MTHPNMDKESENMLDAYIHDYLVKRKYGATSKTFQAEAEVSTDLNVVDAPAGFLYEWWSVFWDIFIARYMVQVPGAVVSCKETQIVQEQEQQKQQQWHQNSQQQQQQQQQQQYNMRIQELLLQRKIQQQKQFLQLLLQQQQQQQREETRHQHGIRQHRISNASTARMYQEGLKTGFGDDIGHLLDPNHGTILKSLAGKSRHTPHATSGCISSYLNPTKHEGVLPLKGWPLMGLDHLRARLLQQQKPMMQSPQTSHQLQLKQQLMLQAQQNLPSSSVNDLECRKLWMLLNEQNISSDGVGVQVGHHVLSRGDLDKQMQNSNEHQQQYPWGALSKHSQNSNYHYLKQDKTVGTGRIALEGCMSNTTRGNDQASKFQTGQKRKWLMSSSLPAAATSSTTGPSPSLALSTPSSHTKEDVLSTPTLPHKEGFSQPSCMVGNSCGGLFAYATNHLGLMDFFVGNGSLDESVDTFLSHDDAGCGVDTCGGFSFSEIGSIHANQVDHCHLSLDGKLLMTSGNDKKAKLWCTDLLEQKCTLEEHSLAITDTRFSPITPRLATSSLDKTVRVWDVENPDHSLCTFVGHSASVISLDFHPNKGDLICSCDDINEIRYWSIKNGGCARVIKGGSTKVRFQPTLGRYIAAAVGSGTLIMDVETAVTCGNLLKGHSLNVKSICWDFSGELLASVSEDLVRVWKIGSGAQHDCIHELSFSAKKFRSCVFHPYYPSLLVIGCSESLELWNMAENKLMTPLGKPISALAVSEMTGLVASACQDNYVKMWKWI